jgi:hypothetical protein
MGGARGDGIIDALNTAGVQAVADTRPPGLLAGSPSPAATTSADGGATYRPCGNVADVLSLISTWRRVGLGVSAAGQCPAVGQRSAAQERHQ